MVVVFYGLRIWRQEENMSAPFDALTASTNPKELFVAALALGGKFTHIVSNIPDVYSMYCWVFPDGYKLYVFCTEEVINNEYGSHLDNCYIQDPE